MAGSGIRLVLWAVLLSGAVGFGAAPYRPVFGDPMRESWRWRSFPELSGLDVLCMTEGANGTMWFGTANGLWSYDGFEWVNHSSLAGDIVTALCSTPDGSVYAGGMSGVSVFRDGRWTELQSFSRERVRTTRDSLVRKMVTGHDGSLWIATPWGALRLRQSTWTLYTDRDGAEQFRAKRNGPGWRVEFLPEPAMEKLNGPANRCDFREAAVDAQGRVWFGAKAGQVCAYVPAVDGTGGGTWAAYGGADGVGAGDVSSICPMQDGTVWVVHEASEHADVFDGRAWKPVRLPLALPALDLGDAGGRLFQTRDGAVWLAARYALFARLEDRWSAYGLPELPYPSTRNVVLQSADGALWFSGPNSEIYRVDYQTSRWVTLEDLNFQWESPAGAQWFLHRTGRIVVHEGEGWTSYGTEDGLIDTPVALLGTRRGEVWVAGSHEHTAATARFDGEKWTRDLHPDFSFAIDWRAVFEAADGSLWFGAFVDTDGPARHRDGLLQYRDGAWTHHHQPGRSPHADGREESATLLPAFPNPDRPIEKFIFIGQSRDGRIWSGRNILVCYDGKSWRESSPLRDTPPGIIETMLTTAESDLWIGTRESGVLRYDGKQWQHSEVREGLRANSVRSLAQTTDGSIWAVTDRGSARFDGSTWMEDVLPEALSFAHESGSLKASPSGRLWINHYTLYWMRRTWTKSPPPAPEAEFRTVGHEFKGAPPRTTLTAGVNVISQPGNLSVLWSGVMPWREPKEARLQFSFRLDDGPWSAFTSEHGHAFFTLRHGAHHLEVRARDADFNVDPTPAVFDFTVLPPVWRQSWFVLLMFLLGGLLAAQTARVLREQRRLRRAHDELEVRVGERTAELESANRELAAANRELEAFSYSVSHDLRAPLRSIDGFSKCLLDDYADKLDAAGREDLHRVRAAAQRMGRLIDDMLKLSRVTRSELHTTPVNLSKMVREILSEFAQREPARQVHCAIATDVVVGGDGALLQIVLENLLGNAWKFTSKRADARIEFGVVERSGERVYFVRDDGAGFAMGHAVKLFEPFQRLHTDREFPGSGVGLAIVQRVIARHGGRVWAESKPDHGATFFFTLGNLPESKIETQPPSPPA